MPNVIRILQLFLPWISLVFMPKKSMRTYFPASLFASSLVIGMCSLAIPYKWWSVKGGQKGKTLNDSSFIFSPFLVGILWIFHFTFGRFKRFFFVNLLMDSLFAFPLSYLYQKLDLFKLVNFKPKHIFFSFISFCLTIYGYQALTNKDK